MAALEDGEPNSSLSFPLEQINKNVNIKLNVKAEVIHANPELEAFILEIAFTTMICIVYQ